MKGVVLSSVVVGCALACAAAPVSVTPDRWSTRTHSQITNRLARHENKLLAAKEGPSKVVFIGDSITHRWERDGSRQLEKYFSQGDWKMLNLGIGGDRTENVLWRITEGGELDGFEAKFISLMIGTNNTGHRPLEEESPEDTVAGVKAILEVIRQKQPQAVVVLTAILPRGASWDNPLRKRNDLVNAQLAELADNQRVFWLDFSDRMVDRNGDTRFMMVDRLHPCWEGYEIWYEEVKPYVEYALSGRQAPAPGPRYSFGQNLAARLWPMSLEGDVAIWPEGQTPFRLHDETAKVDMNEIRQFNVVLTDVNDPYVRPFLINDGRRHPTVVVCPGGGYIGIGVNKEGSEIAEWLNELGFNAFVLCYRCSGQDQRDGALCDLQRTLRLLRRDAERYGIDPRRVGVIGFSAGANLIVRAATNWRKAAYAPVDAADELSCRPDFQLAIYPWDLCERTKVSGDWPKSWRRLAFRFSDYPVDSETPPAFICQAMDDFCDPWTSSAYDFALRRVGADSTLKLYSSGGHGYGMRRRQAPSDMWVHDATHWLARFADCPEGK